MKIEINISEDAIAAGVDKAVEKYVKKKVKEYLNECGEIIKQSVDSAIDL